MPLLALRGITKAFPGTIANDAIDLSLRPGEIHALLGENGAGKSTLVKIIYGVLAADDGDIVWQGKPVTISGPAAARRLGIGMVFQHFSLFEAMTVLENIALAMPDSRDMAALRARVEAVSRTYGLPLAPDRHVHDLSVGERQRIEIVRCLLQDPKLIILDEPTSVLTPQETEGLFQTLRQLAGEGRAILYISHKLAEVRALCQRATILRGGRVVAERDPQSASPRELAEIMVGERLHQPERRPAKAEQRVRLQVDGLSLPAASQFGTALKNVAFSVNAGEIVGIAGVAGNGQGELMAVLTGERLLPGHPEAICIDGRAVANLGPRQRRGLGAAFVPEERHGHGAVTTMNLNENAFLTGFGRLGLAIRGLISPRRTRQFAKRVIEGFDVRTTGSEAQAGSLSGGNLQKFIVGREILQEPGVLVIAQPTWGVDAGAASAIHQALIDLAARGAAVLVISQDLDELFVICDRIGVISAGSLSAPRPAQELDAQALGLLMGGVLPDAPPLPAGDNGR